MGNGARGRGWGQVVKMDSPGLVSSWERTTLGLCLANVGLTEEEKGEGKHK